MYHIRINTSKDEEVLDITHEINKALEKKSLEFGICHLFLIHTTAALTTADLDPGTDLDMLEAWREMVPKLKYQHQHDPSHVPDHILSSMIGTSISIPVQHGELVLGTWQRIVLIELNGPRDRTVLMSFVKSEK